MAGNPAECVSDGKYLCNKLKGSIRYLDRWGKENKGTSDIECMSPEVRTASTSHDSIAHPRFRADLEGACAEDRGKLNEGS